MCVVRPEGRGKVEQVDWFFSYILSHFDTESYVSQSVKLYQSVVSSALNMEDLSSKSFHKFTN